MDRISHMYVYMIIMDVLSVKDILNVEYTMRV